MVKRVGLKTVNALGSLLIYILFVNASATADQIDQNAVEVGKTTVLLAKSVIRPTLFALLDDVLYYSEQSPDPLCPSKDLFSFSNKEFIEKKVLSLNCVSGITAANGHLYVTYQDDSGAKLERLEQGQLVPPGDHFKKQLARAAYLRRKMAPQSDEAEELAENPENNKLEVVPRRWAINDREQVAAIYGPSKGNGQISLVTFSLRDPSKPRILNLDIPLARLNDFTLNEKLEVALTLKNEGTQSTTELWLVDLDKNFTKKLAGKSLPDDRSNTFDESLWALHQTGTVRWLDNIIAVSDHPQTPGSRSSAYFYEPGLKTVRRVNVASTDIFSIVPYHGGWLVSKPLTRQIVYYGDAAELAANWSINMAPKNSPFFTTPEENDGCGQFSIVKHGPNNFEILSKRNGEMVSLGMIVGLVSRGCRGASLSFIASSFEGHWRADQLTALLSADSDVTFPPNATVIAGSKPWLFLIVGQTLSLVREPRLDTQFVLVRESTHLGKDGFTVGVKFGAKALSESDYANFFLPDGQHFRAIYDTNLTLGNEILEKKGLAK